MNEKHPYYCRIGDKTFYMSAAQKEKLMEVIQKYQDYMKLQGYSTKIGRALELIAATAEQDVNQLLKE